jgi:hypothetical protein
LTSQITREDLRDELYKLAGRTKAYEVGKFLMFVDRYAYGLANRIADEQVAEYDRFRHLRPGETDEQASMRRCQGCGQVRHLTKSYARDNRSPNGRKLRCTTCVPPKDNGKYPDKYLCRLCGERKLLKHFPPEKRADPKVRFNCMTCQGIPRPTPQKRK